MAKKQHFDPAIWQKRLHFFLNRPLSGDICGQVDPDGAAPAVLRSFLSLHSPMTVVTDDLGRAEALSAALESFGALLDKKPRILLIPELTRGRLILPTGEERRARVLLQVLEEDFDIAVGSVHALCGPAPAPEKTRNEAQMLTVGMEIKFDALLRHLVELDYDDEFEVSVPGEFARRGGIIDVFSGQYDYPCRIEFWGDRIESLRSFSPETQRSLAELSEYRIIGRAKSVPETESDQSCDFFDYLPARSRLLTLELDGCRNHLEKFGTAAQLKRFDAVASGFKRQNRLVRFESFEVAEAPAAEVYLPLAHIANPNSPELKNATVDMVRESLFRQISQWLESGYTVHLLAAAADGIEPLKKYCFQTGLDAPGLIYSSGSLAFGVFLPHEKTVILTERELLNLNLFKRQNALSAPAAPEQSIGSRGQDFSFADLDEGDLAVHIQHGIAVFRGLKTVRSGGFEREVMVLEYQNDARIMVPLIQAHQLSRYFGAPGKVRLSRLNSSKWNQDKLAAQRSIHSYAAEMLRLQAMRQVVPGIAFRRDRIAEKIFIDSFDFKDTPDQVRATREILADMAGSRPMDRLLCGDVGYGKTELAMRAVFTALSAGFQALVLAPTTVLAQQHFLNFQSRLTEYPFTVELLSRFRTGSEQREILRRLASGGIDVIIGTSSLCSTKVKFKNLGLVVIDEEQRFGVQQKERLRELRAEVDVLTMSATPIPRTLYLAMAGARDLSTLMSAPQLRLPVRTVVAPAEDRLIVEAIRAELRRGGQCYYLHNRVKSIVEKCAELQFLVPECRFAVAHGQMPEGQLEEVMADFLAARIDCLVCSSIIESGLDIPNANTIIIERADRFGLAELYQLRGRVGRWKHQAYAYMLLPKNLLVSSDARKRIAAIRRCTSLGAGFQLALRDLEIRGSGNILGAEQSGHLNTIGFELYCHILKQEVARLSGKAPTFRSEVDIVIDFIAYGTQAPAGYLCAAFGRNFIENDRLRIGAYRHLAALTDENELADFHNELRDRFGKLPPEAETLLELEKIKILAARTGYRTLKLVNGILIMQNGTETYRQDGKLPRVDNRNPPLLRLALLQKILRDAAQKRN